MKTCEKYKNLIEKYIDGTISEGQLAELKAHTETCKSCCDEFERCILVQDVVKEALLSQTSAEQAGASIMARLSEEPNLQPAPTRFSTILYSGRRAAIAAGILLTVGLSLGFALGVTAKSARTQLMAQVPIGVSKIGGTVLVRHEGSDSWQTLETGSNVHLGDTFHSTARSVCRLEFEDESTIELNQNSMLVLRSFNGQTQFFLEHGECTAALESPHGPFFIDTPHGRVEALGTEFTVTVE